MANVLAAAVMTLGSSSGSLAQTIGEDQASAQAASAGSGGEDDALARQTRLAADAVAVQGSTRARLGVLGDAFSCPFHANPVA